MILFFSASTLLKTKNPKKLSCNLPQKPSFKYLRLASLKIFDVFQYTSKQQKQQEIKLNSNILDLPFSPSSTLIFLAATPFQNQPSHFSMQILIAPSAINVLPSGEL
jgi:hypothetical protein